MNKRLEDLWTMHRLINGKNSIELTYMVSSIFGFAPIKGILSDILDRHDKMIREEIDKEIEDINKQIEEL